jgi:hypothetical protein
VWSLARVALTLLAFAMAGFFVAAMGTKIGPVRAFNEPGVPGFFGYQFVAGFAIVLGWTLGSAVEAVWKGSDERAADTPWELFMLAVLPRLIGGVVVFIVIMGLEFGFEALGVGLGGR